MSRETRRLDIGGRRLELGDRAWLMGIVNVTPDSFADGGRYADPARAVRAAEAVLGAAPSGPAAAAEGRTGHVR